MGTIWGSIFAPELTCSASSAYFSRIEKGPKNNSFPEPSQIAKVGPNVAFIQGLILFAALLYVDSVPKMTIFGVPSKINFFQKCARGGAGFGQKCIKRGPNNCSHRFFATLSAERKTTKGDQPTPFSRALPSLPGEGPMLILYKD